MIEALRRHARAAARRPVGHVPAQPRRDRPVAAHRRAARRGVRRVRSRPGHAALRPGHPPPAGPDARRRPAAARAGVLAAVHACAAPRCCATARRSAWATTCPCRAGTPSVRRCSGRRQPTAASPPRTIRSARSSRGRVRVPEGQRDRPAARPGSLLAWFERMIRTLRESPEVGTGTCAVIDDPPSRPACWRTAPTAAPAPCCSCTTSTTSPPAWTSASWRRSRPPQPGLRQPAVHGGAGPGRPGAGRVRLPLDPLRRTNV